MDNETAVMEPNTNVNVIDVSEQVANGNGDNDTDNTPKAEMKSKRGRKPKEAVKREGPRWDETNHVFAKAHPAHELIPSQTAYGRDVKENGVEYKTPEGFERVTVPNLIPSNLLQEVERLCRMHNVDIRDEWRYAINQITEAVIGELSQRPIPENYTDTTKRLSKEQRDALKAEKQKEREELLRLKEEGKKMREAFRKQQEELKKQLAEAQAKLKGEIPSTNGETVQTATDSEGNPLPVLGMPEPPPAPPTPAPSEPVTVGINPESENEQEPAKKVKK